MRAAVSARDRRAIVTGLGIVVVSLLLVRGIPAARALYADQRLGAIEARRHQTSVRRAVASRTVLADSLARVTQEWETQRRRLFDAPTLNALTAQVAGYVSRVGRGIPVDIRSIQVRPDTISRGGFRRVTVSASARTDIRGLMTLIGTLEQGGRLFRIISLTVNQPDVIGRPDAAEVLNIEMTLQALSIERSR